MFTEAYLKLENTLIAVVESSKKKLMFPKKSLVESRRCVLVFLMGGNWRRHGASEVSCAVEEVLLLDSLYKDR